MTANNLEGGYLDGSRRDAEKQVNGEGAVLL
jgi:hypothetical protein